MNKHIETQADFTILFNDHYNHLVIYIMRYVQDVSVAKDLAQETFVVAWEKRDTVKSPISFLFVCARHAAFKYLSDHSKQKFISNDDSNLQFPEQEEDTIEYFERLEKVSAMIDKLSPQCKDVVKKIYFEKKRIAVVAQEMSLSVNTIKTHVKIAKKNLAKLFLILIIIYFSSF